MHVNFYSPLAQYRPELLVQGTNNSLLEGIRLSIGKCALLRLIDQRIRQVLLAHGYRLSRVDVEENGRTQQFTPTTYNSIMNIRGRHLLIYNYGQVTREFLMR